MPAHEDPKAPPRSLAPLLRELGIAVLVFGIAWLGLSSFARQQHPDRTDEPEWVAMGILHWRQFVLGEGAAGAELDPPEERSANPWKAGVQRTVFGYMNPGLPKLILGGVLHAGGHDRADPRTFQIFHREDPAAGRVARAQMEPGIALARRVIQTLAALSALLVVSIGRRLLPGRAGWLTGALAGVLFLASPLVLHTATYVRTDFFMLPFVLGGLLWVLARREQLAGVHGARALHLSGAILGLLCGLAVASKLNGTLVCFCVALWLPLLWLEARGRSRLGFLLGPLAACLVAGAVTCLVFYALDPRLWGEPLEGTRDILERWERQKEVQQGRAERMGTEVVRTLSERLGLFWRRSVGRDDPWHSLTGLPGGALLTLGGLVCLCIGSVRRRAPACVALVFVVVFMLGTALWLPIDWERFFLPAAPCLALLQALSLGSLLQLALNRSEAPPRP